MTIQAPATHAPTSLSGTQESLLDDGIDILRVGYSDLIGTERGRDLVVRRLARTAGNGVAFCRSVYGTTPMGDVVDIEGGLAAGLPDVIAVLDQSTLQKVPWEQGVAHCIADILNPDHTPSQESPRQVLKRVLAQFTELGMTPIVGPELEFYLLEPDQAHSSGWRRYGEAPGNVYVAGLKGDPQNVMLDTLRMLAEYGIEVVAANHEFSSGQFEINLWHSTALDAADRAFRFKTAIQELARAKDKLATFMAKPFNDEGGSGFHLHFSAVDDDGTPLFDDPSPIPPARTVRHRRTCDRRDPRPRAGARRAAQPHDQLLQAVRARHAGPLADRLGPGQPQRDGAHPPGTREGGTPGTPPGRRVGQPLPGYRRAARGRAARDPGRPRRAGATRRLRV
jgi:glutamine synthetase